ncbi:DNA glycosylase [Kitasatospora purpeofusca]|uniref:DNA-formamidopyrimidine glycosylase family protein n=1 Tax=Kitasatospora purpeofusca TaxID=67352 RepID=UPI0022574AF2|nr:DNA-formamidopyrimidine glycosylase family protein [Kitasatospora purpeofusca]MCX4689678.1 DNA glycosylase [Kitasatospora purpeofusca]
MPEGDSVFRVAARLRAVLAGQVLTVAELRVPAHATAVLAGRRVLEVVPRGKHLLTRLEGGTGPGGGSRSEEGLTLHTHLRMDGRWSVFAPGERWTGGPPAQIRVVLGTGLGTAVGYRLPVVELLRTADEQRVVGHLGPDLLGPDWDRAEAVRRLRADPGRPLGEALLDQRNLAGIGNVYANELCYLAGVTPWTPVGELPDLDRLAARAHLLLDANRLRPGHITTGDTRRGRGHWVYNRAGRPCSRCGTLVLTAQHGTPPQDRPAYWCPYCQRGPAPEGRGPGPRGRRNRR